MTTTKDAVAAIVRRIGFDPGRASAVARSLTDSGHLPSGAPGKSPELTPQHVATLMLGVALDTPLRAVATTVCEYRALRREGVPDGAPERISATAGDELDILAEIAATGSPEAKALVAKTIITVVSTRPEIVLADTVDARRFHAGMPGHWQAYGHRSAVEINGGAFADAIRDLFGDENAH
ncbi:MAG: hypothetical protein E5W15_28280 [Mesorhizobium sp.]|uniref:hypothetical protein n=1 Tax=unclassified Mesorhizobium TaxID=325217 RepID=UPI000FCA2C6C|nr:MULTISPECIES: hypothetical protein [unclassified Mesorhizobium]RUW40413.1 hypothetical protein EOA37_15035 [Mesorhizobium sp. M2A.F.Ca.ET.015.02.1.1]RVC97944.1 hypothetical protein EN739_02520 [Mesorhizobium sp. M2A.F.Ca.ET.017.03.2.1]RVD08012.1 hypothetical protein EN753_15785 [Mesorhizobium sp. M2A.F.Ca.ET.029.05.1.1]RWB40635.1 MAG: hypothetical protein EOQ46_24295 [Mesorhizobium sp.]RWB62702.1 MAG: hypothetical protein EOQ48_11280 [Mesorhizobium sp.]